MSYTRRDVVGGAVKTQLASTLLIGASSTTILATTGWPSGSNGPFYCVVDEGLANEEKILVTTRTSATLSTITRGVDGTTESDHQINAYIRPCIAAVDIDEANYTVAETVGKITAAGQLLVADGANSLAATSFKDSGKIPVGNGTTLASVAVSGDATLASDGTLTVANDAITYAKAQDVSATDRLLGRDTAGAGVIEELTVGGGIEFTGTGGIQRSALTGDVTASAGSGTTAIGNEKVVAAMIAAAVAGNGLSGGAGSALAVNVDTTTIAISSDTLQRAAISGDITIAAGSASAAITSGVIVSADFNSEAGSSWTPSVSSWGLGNGSVSGTYIKHGRLIYAQGTITFGSTSTFSGGLTIGGLPVAVAGIAIGSLEFVDVSATPDDTYPGVWTVANGATSGEGKAEAVISVVVVDSACTSTTPFSWTNGDQIHINIMYIGAS